jgi:alginate O-acetyltransferase complex protein AlgI
VLFQSLDFAVFLPIVLAAYLAARSSATAQNAVLVVASYVFYGWADRRFLLLLAATSAVAYLVGRAAGSSNERRATIAVAAGIAINLAVLAMFKYANFFLGSIGDAFALFGVPVHLSLLHVVLPVGISFYTFRSISYMVDVRRGSVEADGLLNVGLFAAFFPYLLAGPVERSKQFLPQIHVPRRPTATDVSTAAHLMLWGLFKKMAIADALSPHVNYIFANYGDLGRGTLLAGVALYSLQLYADFSGYSDIAVGVARVFGLEITQNFRLPYFAANIGDFWRRWHISLYTWFNDYLYTPLSLALRDWGLGAVIVALLITFTLSGLWHGAQWTFVVWGLLHGAYLVAHLLWRKNRRRRKSVQKRRSSVSYPISLAITLTAVGAANVVFRSPTVADALSYFGQIIAGSAADTPDLHLERLVWVAVLPAFEWMQRKRDHPFDISHWHYTARFPIYAAVVFAVFLSIRFTDRAAFLYFKF